MQYTQAGRLIQLLKQGRLFRLHGRRFGKKIAGPNTPHPLGSNFPGRQDRLSDELSKPVGAATAHHTGLEVQRRHTLQAVNRRNHVFIRGGHRTAQRLHIAHRAANLVRQHAITIQNRLNRCTTRHISRRHAGQHNAGT